MAKRPPPGKCVHCCKFNEILTWDHVFPKAWYPETTPPNLAKWKIPSCNPCNSEYGRIEDDLLIKFGPCLDPNDPRSLGIRQRATRALNAECGKDEKDKRAREAKRKQIIGESLYGTNIPQKGIYPNFGNVFNLPNEDQIGIKIPQDSIKKLTQKIVKGITFIENARFIEPPYGIDVYVVEDKNATQIVNQIKTFGKVYAREPGITVIRAVLPDDGMTSICLIEIWGRFKMYAHVGNEAV